ncbi:MAG TPA: DedA family protein [Chthoniobacteraceae bacterium]|jgi:membrane protein DedA with SNARE-associated domain|nr:DedA family protein [Chthoniobacteraceae bacterium]
MEQLLLQYGLVAVFLCAVVENDVTFLLTGVIAHLGLVHPLFALIYCIAGALVHDSLWFWLGYSRSESVRASRVYRKVGPLVEKLADRFGPWELFLCRFIYGTRSPSLVFWGVQQLSYTRFLLIETLALTVWGTILAGVGYGLSGTAAALMGRVRSMEHWVLGAAVIIVIVVLAMRYFARHEIRKHLPPREGPL